MHEYRMGNDWLSCSIGKKEMRVIADHGLNRSQQCALIAKNPIAYWVRLAGLPLANQVIIPLYSVLMRPHLEYVSTLQERHRQVVRSPAENND